MGTTPMKKLKKIMAMKKKAKIALIIARVVAAFFSLGLLKLGTALLTASTPVSDEEPAEKARINRTTLIPATGVP